MARLLWFSLSVGLMFFCGGGASLAMNETPSLKNTAIGNRAPQWLERTGTVDAIDVPGQAAVIGGVRYAVNLRTIVVHGKDGFSRIALSQIPIGTAIRFSVIKEPSGLERLTEIWILPTNMGSGGGR